MVEPNNTAPASAPQSPTTGGIVGVVVDGVREASRFSAPQVVNVIAFMALFSLGFLTYFVVNMLVELRMAEMRNSNEREELIRQHCTRENEKTQAELEKARAFYALQMELQRKHDSERDDKTRALLLAHLRGKE